MQDQPRQDLRGLKALVGIMGVLIVLGTALVIGVVIHRLYARNGVASNVAVATRSGAVPAGGGQRAAGAGREYCRNRRGRAAMSRYG